MTYLQNHIGDLRLPGEKYFHPDWAQRRVPAGTLVASKWVLVGALVTAAVTAVSLLNLADTPTQGRTGLLVTIAVGSALTLALTALAVGRYRAVRSSLWRAQRDYAAATGRSAPTVEQLQALQASTPWDYRDCNWGHSLAKFPCEREVGHLPDWRERFAMLDPGSLVDTRAALVQWWSIATPASYRDMVRQLFGGLHSRDFELAYLGGDAGALVDRLAGLSDLPAAYIEQTIHGVLADRGTRPAAKLWGWDVGRVAGIARAAYAAGLIDADEAWADLTRASEHLRTIFATREEYFRNVLLGYAYWSDDYVNTAAFGQALSEALTNPHGWPVLAQPWQPMAVALPAEVWRGWDATNDPVDPTPDWDARP